MDTTKLPHHDSFCERLATLFRARPGEWIDARDLMARGGTFAWRTRVADLRRAPFNMDITNRLRRVRQADAGGRMLTFCVSEYQFKPKGGESRQGAVDGVSAPSTAA